MQDFAQKVAVVTGAGSGIGRALAHRAAAEGMKVVAADVEQPRLDDTVASLTGAGAEAIGVRTDVSLADDVARLADTAFERYGGVHLLCNNAGVFSGGFVWDRTLADWDWVLGVNLYGIVHAIRSFVPRMIAQDVECHVVNTASMGGLVTNAYSGPYYTSKFAAVGLTDCLAHDLAAAGTKVGVSVLVPSLVATDIGTSERNRHERYVDRDRLDLTPDAAFVAQALRESTTGAGMAPDEVAALVFDAVRAGRYWIPTKPSYHEQIAQRHEDMQALRLPRPPRLD